MRPRAARALTLDRLSGWVWARKSALMAASIDLPHWREHAAFGVRGEEVELRRVDGEAELVFGEGH